MLKGAPLTTALPVRRDFRLVAFDWDGTAVVSRAEHPGPLADAMERLLRAGVTLVVITGTNATNVSGQIAPLLSVEARRRLYLMVNRGSEVYAYHEDGELELLDRREATDDENAALDRTATAMQQELGRHGIEVGIVWDRLNRRKIDLIPEPDWADPPKDQIGELLEAVEQRLTPLAGGLGGAIELANQLAEREGLVHARITSDVKHVEIGLTDKSDSIAFLMRRLVPARSIRPNEVLIGGDEFGPISGVEGSDYRMVTRLAEGATLISVGREPNGTPAGVIHIGGGPENFVRLLNELEPPAGTASYAAPARPHTTMESDPAGWQIVTDGYDLSQEASQETLHVLCNGWMGVRGSADELNPARSPRTFIAGLFDGDAPGVEDLVVVPDWTAAEIWVDGRAFEPWHWTVRSHRRRLDLRALELDRELVVEDPDGRVLKLTSNRIVSLAERHVAAVRLSLELVSGPGAHVTLRAGAQAWEREGALPHVVVTAAGDADGVDMLHTRTPGGRVAVDVAQAMSARLDGSAIDGRHVTAEQFSGREVEAHLGHEGSTLEVERHIAIYTERNHADPGRSAAERARASAASGWAEARRAHVEAWAAAWTRSDVEIDEPGAQLGVRFAAAQLIAAAPPVGSRTSVAAKGLTGDGYKGHVFWDTDVFLMQFYSYTMPEVAREIIGYRIGTLPAARRNAVDAGVEGAWYAWESAATGEDVTPAFVVGPGGRRMEVKTGQQEIHVVSDIALAIDMYLRITGDTSILAEGAADVVVEAARFYATRGVETERGYEIHGVIGPDELHEDVDNSAFTNYLGAWTMRWAAELVESGVAAAPAGEAARWRDLADRMLIFRTPDGVLEQHEGFLSLPIVETDEAGRAELAWQRERLERRDVKQADVVMLMALREADFTREERLASYRLYEPLTRHLSSLSEAVHSLVARRAGLDDAADDYLRRAIAIDLYDSRGNRPEGLHMATQGGLWQAVVLGCAGLSSNGGVLHLDPRVAPGWNRLRFALTHHGVPVRVTLSPGAATVDCYGGEVDVELPGISGKARDGAPFAAVLEGDAWRVAP